VSKYGLTPTQYVILEADYGLRKVVFLWSFDTLGLESRQFASISHLDNGGSKISVPLCMYYVCVIFERCGVYCCRFLTHIISHFVTFYIRLLKSRVFVIISVAHAVQTKVYNETQKTRV